MAFTPLTLEQLRQAQCRHMEAEDRLDDAAIAAQLPSTPQWQVANNTLRRTFHFGNYYETLAALNAMAWIFHRQDHHPELKVTYNAIEVALDTHSAGGLSPNDFIVAAQLDQLLNP